MPACSDTLKEDMRIRECACDGVAMGPGTVISMKRQRDIASKDYTSVPMKARTQLSDSFSQARLAWIPGIWSYINLNTEI